MQRLKNPQLQIPNGFYYRQPEIKWDSKKALGLHPSLDVLTRALINARRAHPHYVAQHNWSLDFNTVRAEVEAFQVKVCLANGWTQYLTDGGGGAPPPLATAPNPQEQEHLAAVAIKARRIWGSRRTTSEWKKSGEVVPQNTSEHRASICIECPQNDKTDLDKGLMVWLLGHFTTQAAKSIKEEIEWKRGMNLSTTHDKNLAICQVCLCPLETKVHAPLKYIKENTDAAQLNELSSKGKNCWIVSEIAAEPSA